MSISVISRDFCQKLASVLTVNTNTVLSGLDMSFNLIEDKGIWLLISTHSFTFLTEREFNSKNHRKLFLTQWLLLGKTAHIQDMFAYYYSFR